MARWAAGVVAFAALAAGTAAADDVWEKGTIDCKDDTRTTCNQLMPGVPQVHDIQGTFTQADIDYMVVETKARRSYEVDVRGANIPFQGPGATGCELCPRIDRMGPPPGLTPLTPGVPIEPGSHPFANGAVRHVVRWTGGAADQRDFIRVTGTDAFAMTENDRYEIVLRDTTLAVPRWNNSGTQSTTLLLANQAPHAIQGQVHFYDGQGTLLESVPFAIPRFGMVVMPTVTRPALQSKSGSAAVTHNAGYGELAGKAVALEPSTGFAFDTTMTATPY